MDRMKELWDQRGLVEDVLARGVDDWVDLGLVVHVARRGGPLSDEARTALAIGLVTIVIVEGLMWPGAVRDRGFHPWQEEPADAVARIVREWRLMGTGIIRPGDIAWLRNTDAGDARGRAVLRREGTEP